MADRFDAFGQRIYPAATALKPFVVDDGKWHALEPTQTFPAPLRQATELVSSALSAVTAAGKITEKALQLAQRFATVASTDPIEQVLRNALSQVDAFVTGIDLRTQCHAIMIPIRKRTVREGQDHSSRFDAFLHPDEPAYAYVNTMRTAQGGTRVFYRTLVASVSDAGDPSRPQFPANYATTGVCLMAGAETLSDLQVPLRLFAMLFGSGQRVPAAANILPVVQNLKVTPAAVAGGVAVMLRWDPLPPRTNTPLYTNDIVRASEIFIIRTTEPPGAQTWDDLFPGVTPSDDRTDLPTNGRAQVVARVRNHGFVTSYTDTQNLLKADATYYFTTCVRYQVGGVQMPMGSLSNSVRVTRSSPSPVSARGMSPDWVATPSFARLMPPLNHAVNRVRLAVSRLGSRTTSNSGSQQLLQQTVAQVQRLTQQWEATAQQVAEITTSLNALTQTGTPTGIYSTTITRSTGGVDGWLAELSRRLADVNDRSRPNFSNESVVIGFVILAGAPRLPDLSALTALLDMLFGKHAKNPLLDVNRALDRNPAGPVVTSTSTATPILGYDDALRPSPRPTC